MIGSHLTLTFGTEGIYDDTNFNIHELDKIGIVGVNGAGKTTLFKIILKELPLDGGKITISKGKRIGYLPQEIKLDDPSTTVFDYLMCARPIDELNNHLIELYDAVSVELDLKQQEKLLNQISKTQELLEYYDCYQAESILFELIDQLHIDSNLLDMKLIDLSGGQKSKIAFAHLLYSNPEIMLLDEPTNHLDVDTKSFITDYLKHYKGMILIISHDVEFLDSIVDHIMYVNKTTQKITMYNGNYTIFMKKLTTEEEIKDRLIEKQQKEISEIRSFVLQYSNSSGKRKRIAESREKLLAKKMKDVVHKEEEVKRVKLNLKPNREGSKIPIKVNQISFHYDNVPDIIHHLSFVINASERFLIVGENGVGKSTLLKLLVEKLKPNEGNIWFGSKTDLAYYAQELELLDPNKTIFENVDRIGYSPKELRTVLGSFLFIGDDVFKKVAVLSPGEKARVSLCKVMLERANLLILDEPTNHLDPQTQAIIGENFRNYEGTIILVSHNSSFVEHVGIDRMLILPSGKITNYQKELLDHYQKLNETSRVN